MARSTEELTTQYSALALKVSNGEWKTTVRIKSNGTEYGPTLAAGLPILNEWAVHNTMPESILDQLKRSRAKGSAYQRACLILCGRGEAAHNTGIAVHTDMIGKEAATAACKAAGQASAQGLLKDLEAAKSAQDKATKRKVQTAKRKAAKSKQAPATKPAEMPVKMPAGNAG